jgi:hypothetical protein
VTEVRAAFDFGPTAAYSFQTRFRSDDFRNGQIYERRLVRSGGVQGHQGIR